MLSNFTTPGLFVFQAYANEEDKALVFVTAHKGGKINVWENMEWRDDPIDYRTEITAITCLDFAVVIATESAMLYFVSIK